MVDHRKYDHVFLLVIGEAEIIGNVLMSTQLWVNRKFAVTMSVGLWFYLLIVLMVNEQICYVER